MSISFSGLASGLDTSSWVEALVAVKQEKVTAYQTSLKALQTQKSTLSDTRSAFTSLRTAIEKLTDMKFGGSFDLFAKNMATSSNDAVFTATANGNAARQSYDIKVEQLATYTKAMSKDSASAVADDDTKLKDLGITKGSFTTYVNGKKNTIDIGENDTLGDLKSRLDDFGVKAEISADGVMKISAKNEGDTIDVGATTDKSNLVSLVGLEKQEDGTYASTNSLFKANIATKLTAEDSGFKEKITAGTFTIGAATFTIDENTTLSSLISKINDSDEAQAYAYWDDATGKLSITSTKEGASYINIEAGTSNFTDVMGLTQTTTDADGNQVSKMYTEAQELGKNAVFTINGTKMTSTSNTVTSDISRIEGVTLTLKKVSSEEDGVSTLNVSQNTDDLKGAINEFIKAYNDCFAKVEEVTANGADLHGETSLTSLRNTLRSYANSSNDYNGGVYKLLADIGITTAAADGKNLSTDTNTLKLDEEKFLKALEENPESVKSILGGENGILARMEDAVEQSLQATTGFFDVKTSTFDSDIKKMEDKITKKNKSVETYRAQLEKKFYKMELAISQMQQNYSSFLS